MTSFLLHRPIAVIMTTLAALTFSVLALRELPVSLLPDIDVPQIVIRINYPNGSPEEIENNILRPIRESLATLDNVTEIESDASSETGKVNLYFQHGTSMNLTYIDANEKIDRLSSALPGDLERPKVIRLNTSDIPIVHIQMIPKNELAMLDMSKLAEKVIKKRLESLKGVSLVDLNGVRKPMFTISPYKKKLRALGLTVEVVSQAIREYNLDLEALTVKDGHYRYFLKIAKESLQDVSSIKQIPVKSPTGKSFALYELALVESGETKTFTYHLFNNLEGIVITVHKQAQAQMNNLIPLVYVVVEQLKKDFPEVEFKINRDQSELLNAGVDNLRASLLFGGLFAFAILFVFMGNFRIPLIIGISLPSSILLSFLVFSAFSISLNIISLSGLALGLGMLIDNAIIVLDNITRNLKEQKISDNTSLFASCVSGVNEVITPLISSMLTTLAIFIPLVFLNGLTGSLFYDQAIAVAATLGTSLLVAFILLPMCYLQFFRRTFRKGGTLNIAGLFKETKMYKWVLRVYEKALIKAFKHAGLTIFIIMLIIPIGIFVGYQLKLTGLPDIKKTELLLFIDWKEPIGVQENRDRVKRLVNRYHDIYLVSESDVGSKQFLAGNNENSIHRAEVYFKFLNQDDRQQVFDDLTKYMHINYPYAKFKLLDAPNAFNQLFDTTNPYFEARFKNNMANETLPKELITSVLDGHDLNSFREGKGYAFETNVLVRAKSDKLAMLHVDYTEFVKKLNELFADNTITEIRRFSEVMPIKLRVEQQNFEQKLKTMFIDSRSPDSKSNYGTYPLNVFMDYEFVEGYKSIAADRSGIYHSVYWDKLDDYSEVMKSLTDKAATNDSYTVSFAGDYFKNMENAHQLYFILIISLSLLFFILAAQFESFVQPLIVVLTFPLGIGGSLLFLWMFGNTLNIMSGIGVVVMLGILVNDAILKIDTINRLALKEKNLTKDQLKDIIFLAGRIRLKPILMTSLTTILALVPVLFSSGLGSDLQTPLILSVMGGLTIGTITALFFIPLAYYNIRSINLPSAVRKHNHSPSGKAFPDNISGS